MKNASGGSSHFIALVFVFFFFLCAHHVCTSGMAMVAGTRVASVLEGCSGRSNMAQVQHSMTRNQLLIVSLPDEGVKET